MILIFEVVIIERLSLIVLGITIYTNLYVSDDPFFSWSTIPSPLLVYMVYNVSKCCHSMKKRPFIKVRHSLFIGLGNSQKPKSKISGQKNFIISYHGYESDGYPLGTNWFWNVKKKILEILDKKATILFFFYIFLDITGYL